MKRKLGEVYMLNHQHLCLPIEIEVILGRIQINLSNKGLPRLEAV